MNLSGITWQGQWHRFLWTETASRCSYLRPALQTAPLWSEKDIFEVQFEVNIHPRHSDRPERGWVSPETGWCSQWSRAPGTKPEPAEEQRIYSGERAVTAQAPMALFGKACTFSPSLSLSPLSTSPLRLHSVWSGSSSSSDVFPMWLPGTHKHTHTQAQSLQLSTAVCAQSSCCPAEVLLLWINEWSHGKWERGRDVEEGHEIQC